MATDYYVDNVDGDDGNAGTSPGAGNAFETIQHAVDTANTAGDNVYVKKTGTTYDLGGTAVDFDLNDGSTNAYISVIGYESTITDNVRVPVTQSGAVLAFDGEVNGQYYWIRNFEFTHTGTATYVVNFHQYCRLDNCDCICNDDVNDVGMYVNQYGTISHCRCINAQYEGLSVGSYGKIDSSFASGCGRYGLYNAAYGAVVNSVSVNNAYGVGLGNYAQACIGNSIYNATTAGLYCTSTQYDGICKYNIFSECAYGISFNSANNVQNRCQYNAFYNSGTADYNNRSGDPTDIALSADPFTNAGAGDFTLNDTAGGGAACRGVEIPRGLYGETTNVTYVDLGALQHEESAAASGGSSVYLGG